MKTFLNVLYRRILYKIPLKLLLVLLAVFAVLFACFSHATDYVIPNPTTATTVSQVSEQGMYEYLRNTVSLNNSHITFSSDYDFYCFRNQGSCTNCTISTDGGNTFNNAILNNLYCVPSNVSLYFQGNFGNVYFFSFKSGSGAVPKMTTMQCQTEYNLIPVSSVDSEYCENNNLCPTYDCPINPIGTGTLSNLYINNILHIGAPNIIMNIPEEIDWDYAYTAGGQNMNIDVVGYNVDYEKIDSIVQLQNYKPTDNDFSKIISVLAPYSKIIIFFVVLFSLWAMIKKPFKSKKL